MKILANHVVTRYPVRCEIRLASCAGEIMKRVQIDFFRYNFTRFTMSMHAGCNYTELLQ